MYEKTYAGRVLNSTTQLTSLGQWGPSQERQWLDLLAECFGSKEYPTYVEDFPIWREARADTVRLVALRAQNVVATLGMRFAEIKPDRTRVGLVGAVATRADARGGGLATALVEEAVALADRAGVKTLLLWGEGDLYQRFGFREYGQQQIISLSPVREGALSAPVRPARREFTPLLLPLMQARKTGLVRTFADLDLLGQHRNTQWRVQMDDAGAPTAFIAYGRGVDLPGIVHEWGGRPEGVRQLLDETLAEQPGLLLMGREAEFRQLGVFESTPIVTMSVALVRGPVPKDLWLWGLDGV